MNRIHLLVIGLASTIVLLGCTSLSYPESPENGAPSDSSMPAEVVADSGFGEETEDALAWSDLTRLAREHQRRGELDEANQRLEQAASLVSNLPASHVHRRTVFGSRARLAEQMAAMGETDAADALAAELVAEAEASPEIAGTALVSLALSIAKRKLVAADESGELDVVDDGTDQLPLLATALVVSQNDPANRQRLILASTVAGLAIRAQDLDTARAGLDQAIEDTEKLYASQTGQIADLRLQRGRIAIAQGDFEMAVADSTYANGVLEDFEAAADARGYSNATLAEGLAMRGDDVQALAKAQEAVSLLDGDEEISPHVQRAILGALARVEKSMGDHDLARRHFDEALALPAQESDLDKMLVADLTRDRAALDTEPLSE